MENRTLNDATIAGVTLRDYFAAQIIGAVYSESSSERPLSSIAAESYRVADAMLKESGTTQEQSPNQTIPRHAVCLFQDGDKICAVYGDFKNLQESIAGFGDDFMQALDDLRRQNKPEGETKHEKA